MFEIRYQCIFRLPGGKLHIPPVKIFYLGRVIQITLLCILSYSFIQLAGTSAGRAYKLVENHPKHLQGEWQWLNYL